MSKQYDGIYRYDTVVETDKKQLTADLTDLLDDPENFSGWQRAYQRSAELKNGGNTITAYLFVPEDAGALKSFINLRTRGSGADVPFDEGSAVLSEKTARLLGVDVGGAVTLENDDGEDVSFTVTGITENYIYHYLYIAPEVYAEKMGKEPGVQRNSGNLQHSGGSGRCAPKPAGQPAGKEGGLHRCLHHRCPL